MSLGDAACTSTDAKAGYVSSYTIQTLTGMTKDSCVQSCCNNANCYAVLIYTSSGTCYLKRTFPSSAVSSSSTYSIYYVVRDSVANYLDVQKYGNGDCSGSVTTYSSYGIDTCVSYQDLAYTEHAYHLYQLETQTSSADFTVRHLIWFEAPGCTSPESEWTRADVNETQGSSSCYDQYRNIEVSSNPRDIPESAVTTEDTYQPQYVIWRKYAEVCDEGPPQRASYSIGQCHEEETQRDSFKFETTGTHPTEGYQMEVSWWDGSTSCSGSPSSKFNITWGCRSTNPGSGYFTFSSSSVSSTCSATTTTGVSRYVSTSYRLASYSYTTWDACLTSCCSRTDCYAFMRTSTICYLMRQFPSSAPSSSSSYTLYYMVRDGKSKPGAFLDTRVYNSDGCGGSVTDYISYPIESCVPYKYLEYHNNAYQMFQVDSYTSTRNFVLRHLVWFEAPGCTAPESDWDTPDINTTRSSDSCYKNYTFYELKHAPRDPPVSAVSTQDNYQPQYVIWRKYAGTCSLGPPQRASYSIGQCHEEETQRNSFKFETTGTHPTEGYQMEVSWWGSSTSCSGSPSSRFNITWGCRSTNPGSGYFTFSSSSVSSTCSATTTTGVSRYVSTSYRLASYSYTTWDACLTSCCSRTDCYAFMRTSSICYLMRQFPSSAPSSSSSYTLYYMVRDGKSKPGAFLDTRVYNSDGCGGSVTDYISYPIESCVPYKYLEYHNNAYQMFQVDSYTSTRNFVLRHLVWFEAPGCTAPESDWDTPDINTTRSSDSCYKNYTFYELKHAPRDPPVSAVSTQDNYQPQYVIWRKYAGTCSAGPPQRASYSIGQCHEEETQRDSFKFETTGTHPAEGYQMEVSWWDSSTSCSGSPSSRFNITWGCRSTNPGSGYFTFSSSSVSSTCSATTTTGVSRYVSTSYRLASYSYTTWDACLTSCCSRTDCYAFMRTSTICYLMRQFPSSAPSSSSSYTLYYMVRDGKSKPGAFLDTRVYNSDGCGGSVTDYISYPIESCVPYKYLEYHNNAYQMFQVDSYTSTRNFVLRHLVWFEAPGCTAPESDWDTPDINTTRSSDSCYKNYTFYELKHAPRDPPVSAVSTQDNYQPQYVIWRKYAGTCSAGPPQRASYSIGQCHEEETQRDSFKFETTGTHPAEGYQMEVSWWDSSTSCSGSPSSRFNITWGCRSTNPGSGYFTFSSSSVSSTCSATTTTGVSRYVSTSYRLASYSYTTWDACLTSCCSRTDCYAFMRTSTICYLMRQFPSSAPSSSSSYTLYYMVRDGKSKPGAFLDTRVYNSDGCGGSVTDYISYPIESCIPYKYLEYHNNAYQMFQVDSYTSTRNFVLRHLVWFEAPGCTAPESDWDTPDINTTRSSDSCYKNYTFYELKHAPRDPPVSAVSTQDNYQPQYVIWRKYAGTCSAGPPQRASYSIDQCYEEETQRDSFKFETTGTHPAEGYQMEVSWWDGSTSCSGSPSSKFNITWGCRSTNPGSGYFTFSSSSVSSTCSATTTTGVSRYVSTSYRLASYSYTTWDACLTSCCSRTDCYAFMRTSTICYLMRQFPSSAPSSSSSYTLYYMVRDSSTTPRGYVDTRVYRSSSCTGSITDYTSFPLGHCTRYTYLEYTDHTYQMVYLDSYTNQNTYSLRHLVWHTAPGCTVDSSQWNTPDINVTRNYGDCFQDYSFWTAKYAPYTRDVESIVTGADSFVPTYVDHKKYSTPCTSSVTEQLSYQLGYCYQGYGGSFTIRRTTNHATYGYQMKVEIWSVSTSCSGDPSEVFTVVWGCRVATSFSGDFTFSSSPSYTVPEGFELSSPVAMSSSTTSSSSSTSASMLSSSSSIYSSSSSSPFSSSTLPTTTMVPSSSSSVPSPSSVVPSSSSVVPSSSSVVPSSSSVVPSSSSVVSSSSSVVPSSSSAGPSSSSVIPSSSSVVPSLSSMLPSSSSVVISSSSVVPSTSSAVQSATSVVLSSSSVVPSSSAVVPSTSSAVPSATSVVLSSSSVVPSSSAVVTSLSSVESSSSSVVPSATSVVTSSSSVVTSSSSVEPSSFSSAVPSSSQAVSSVIQSASLSNSLSTSSVSPASSSSMQSSTASCGLLPSPTPLSHPVCPEATTTRGLSVVVVQSEVYLLRHLSGVTKEQCFIACCSNDDCYSFTQSLTSNECWLYRQHPQTAVQVSEHHTTFYMVRNSPGPYLDAWLYSGEGCTSLSGYTSYSLGTCVPYMGLSYAEHSYQLFQLECFSSSEFTVRHLVWYEAPGCTVPRNEWSTPNVNESVESSKCYGNVRFFSVKDQPRDIPIEAVTEVDNFVPTYVNYVKYSSCGSSSVISRVSYKTGECYAENRDSFMFEQTSGHPTSGYQMKVKWWSGTPTCSGSHSQQFYIIWGCQVTSMFTGMFSFTDSAQFVLPGQSVTATPTNEPTDAPPKVAEQTSTIIGASVAVCVVIIAVVIVAVVVVIVVVLFKVKKKQTIELSNDYGNFSEYKWDVFNDAEEHDVMTIRNPLSDIDFDKMDED